MPTPPTPRASARRQQDRRELPSPGLEIERARRRLNISQRRAADMAAPLTPDRHMSNRTWATLVAGGKFERGVWVQRRGKPGQWAAMAYVVQLEPETLDLIGEHAIADDLRALLVAHPRRLSVSRPRETIDAHDLFHVLVQFRDIAGDELFREVVDQVVRQEPRAFRPFGARRARKWTEIDLEHTARNG